MLDAERLERVRELFHAAVDRAPEERGAFLDGACADDPEVRAEVESLISAHDTVGGDFLEAPAARVAASVLAAGQPALEAGRRVGSYRILATLGAGGMGRVYLAEDERLGRRVAIKLLPPSFTSDGDRLMRFEQEARAASALNHPNILTIHEIGEQDGLRFIATEYVEGETLRERLRRGPLAAGEALDLSVQIADALSATHAAGIVHRDVKPENVMLRPDGYVKVLDFGLAKAVGPRADDGLGSSDTHSSLPHAIINTQPGMIMGTVAYMSPEQARGLEVDARTDVWSLGVVLYEGLAGRVPFQGPTASDVMACVLQREPQPLGEAAPAIPSELERIVTKALAKDRDERYQTAKDLRFDLRRLKQRLDFETEMSHTASAGAVNTAGRRSPLRSGSTEGRAHAAPDQLKQVTVLFADLRGLTALADGAADLEEATEVMREAWRRVDAVVASHGGAVERRMGEQVMALWGTAVAQEDDPEHAVRAALDAQKELADFLASRRGAADGAAAGAPLRIGVNTGLVVLSAEGVGAGYAATGPAINAAHRLAQAAPPGAVLITHDTYGHVRGVFDVSELELPGLKGGAEPVRTFLVERAKPRAFRVRTRGVEGVETRMVGRQGELARMRDALAAAVEDGEPQFITVLGDAGLGKSRLLYEFGNEVELLSRRVSVFQGRASQWTRGLPFSLVRDLFSYRFAVQDGEAAETARAKLERGLVEFWGGGGEAEMRAHFIGHLAGLDFSASPHLAGILGDARQVRGRAFHYAAQFFSEAARREPAVVYLDDLHWADDVSLDFLDHLARTCVDVPLLVLCFARPDLLERRPAWGEGLERHARLTLQPLTRRESRQLVEEILRHARSIPHALRELVVSAAEGNPFYVEELIKMLIDQRVILPADGGWGVDASRLIEVRVPPTLTGVLQARLDVLSPWEKVVLQRASVIGREFWEGALEHFSREAAARGEPGEGDTASALDALRSKELVFRRESSGFEGTREYIFKHALLRSVTYETLLKRDRRGLHAEAAGWLVRRGGARADEYAAVIAEHFESARDFPRAAHWYGRAGAQARASYSPEAAIVFYRKALDFTRTSAGEDAEPLRAQSIDWHGGLGEVLTMQARYDEAAEAFAGMREAAEGRGDPVAQARAWNGLTAVQEYQGDNRAALDSARRAEELSRAAGQTAAAKAELAVALNRQGLASHRLGDVAAVAALGEQLLALGDVVGGEAPHARANGLKLLGVAHEVSGRFAEADECFARSLALLRELGDRRNIGFMLNNLGVNAHLRADFDAAARRYEEALSIFREIGERTWELPTLGNLAGARVGAGDYATAEDDLRQALALVGPAGHFALSMIHCYLAESLWGQGRAAVALPSALKALDLGTRTENQDYIANAWRTLGLIASTLGAPVWAGDGGRGRTAAECFAEGLRVYTEMGAEGERARTLRDWARHEIERGDARSGEEMWREAREIFSRLRMGRELERMSRERAPSVEGDARAET